MQPGARPPSPPQKPAKQLTSSSATSIPLRSPSKMSVTGIGAGTSALLSSDASGPLAPVHLLTPGRATDSPWLPTTSPTTASALTASHHRLRLAGPPGLRSAWKGSASADHAGEEGDAGDPGDLGSESRSARGKGGMAVYPRDGIAEAGAKGCGGGARGVGGRRRAGAGKNMGKQSRRARRVEGKVQSAPAELRGDGREVNRAKTVSGLWRLALARVEARSGQGRPTELGSQSEGRVGPAGPAFSRPPLPRGGRRHGAQASCQVPGPQRSGRRTPRACNTVARYFRNALTWLDSPWTAPADQTAGFADIGCLAADAARAGGGGY